MARPQYQFEGKPATIEALSKEFSAYGRNSIRDGLRAGHTTRESLLAYLVARMHAATTRQGGLRANTPRLVYSSKPKGA